MNWPCVDNDKQKKDLLFMFPAKLNFTRFSAVSQPYIAYLWRVFYNCILIFWPDHFSPFVCILLLSTSLSSFISCLRFQLLSVSNSIKHFGLLSANCQLLIFPFHCVIIVHDPCYNTSNIFKCFFRNSEAFVS